MRRYLTRPLVRETHTHTHIYLYLGYVFYLFEVEVNRLDFGLHHVVESSGVPRTFQLKDENERRDMILAGICAFAHAIAAQIRILR